MSNSISARKGRRGGVNITATLGGNVEIVDYDQGKDERWSKFPSTEYGACFALSILWINNRRRGIELIDWLKPPKAASSQGIDQIDYHCTNDARQLMADQDRRRAQTLKVFTQTQQQMPGSLQGLELRDVFQNNLLAWASAKSSGRPSAEKIQLTKSASVATVGATIAKRSGYCLLGFWIQGVGGHACAADCTGTDVIYFEPNWGVFRVPKAEFDAWLHMKVSNAYQREIFDSAGVIDA